MGARDFGGVEVQFCAPGCGAIWFEWSGLSGVDEPHEGFGAALEAALSHSAGPARTGPLECTRCSIPMQERRYQNLRAVMIDECYGCRGLFLDPGELASIRSEIGQRTLSEQSVLEAIRRDPVLNRELLNKDLERDRAKVLETVSRVLTRKMLWIPTI